MATYNKFNSFTTDLTNGKHDFSAAVFKVLLTNTAPVATNTIKANITEITAANGYTAGGATSAITKSNTTGIEKVLAADATFTAAGGPVGPFQYAVLYNDTQTTPAKPLVAWFDYGSAVTLAAGEQFTVDFDGTNGLFTLG